MLIKNSHPLRRINCTLYSALCTLFLLFLTAGTAAGDFTVCAGDYGSIAGAMEAIPQDAGKVTLLLWRSIFDEESDTVLSIPTDRGITEFIIRPDEGIERISLPGLYRICANGIPLTVEAGLTFENANIYGGACLEEGEARLERSSVTLNGAAAFVFGGGLAQNGAFSAVSEPSVTIGKQGSVWFEVFGGGHAFGEGSRVSSERTTVLVEGTVDYALGGGFAEDGGTSECEAAYVSLSENALAAIALFTGGSAAGKGSLSTVENAKAVVAGRAVSAFSGDFAYRGGVTKLNLDSRLEILASGVSEYAYLGSFASDPGSDAWVNTSELMNCGKVSAIYQKSQTADNATAKTFIPALFPCLDAE